MLACFPLALEDRKLAAPDEGDILIAEVTRARHAADGPIAEKLCCLCWIGFAGRELDLR